MTWYDRHGRDLPWRKTRDPYAIWVSEVMLQQTQVKTVVGYYERWMRRFPTFRALARARESQVLHAWQGLGYYSRARRLHATARIVVTEHGGLLPTTREALLALPGLGAYSAGAIASIAFGERVPVVDGNVVRVLTRLYALRGDPARAPLKARLWQLAGELVPAKRPGDFNQALMELGATVCTPREPRCDACPLRRDCLGHTRGVALELPELAKRATATDVRVAAAVVRRAGRLLLVRVPDSAPRWAGLWIFPSVELEASETVAHGAARAAREQAGLVVRVGERAATARYSVTRFRMTLEALDATPTAARTGSAKDRSRRASGQYESAYLGASELGRLAMPSPHRRLARLLAPRAGAA